MANLIYNRLFFNSLSGIVNLANAGDTIQVALLKNTHVGDKDDNGWADVSADEVVGSGYSTKGETLGSQAVAQDDTGDRAWFDGADTTFTAVTLTGANAPRFAVLFSDNLVGDDLICLIDFGADKPCDGGNFQILWDAQGILELEQTP